MFALLIWIETGMEIYVIYQPHKVEYSYGLPSPTQARWQSLRVRHQQMKSLEATDDVTIVIIFC